MKKKNLMQQAIICIFYIPLDEEPESLLELDELLDLLSLSLFFSSTTGEEETTLCVSVVTNFRESYVNQHKIKCLIIL